MRGTPREARAGRAGPTWLRYFTLLSTLREPGGQFSQFFCRTVMAGNQSEILKGVLARWVQGGGAGGQGLVGGAYERLRRLAHVILNEDFPRLKGAPALLQTTDVANEVALGLYQA